MNQDKKPLILLTINAWGIAEKNDNNAISLADPLNFYELVKEFPVATIKERSKNLIERYNLLAKGSAKGLTISELISQSNLKQVFISSEEFFLESFAAFSGEKLLNNQELVIVDQLISDPLKQAEEIIKKSKEIIKSQNFQFININLPTISQIYQTGDKKKIIKAISRIDKYLGKLSDLALLNNYSLLITSLFSQAENLNNLPTKATFYPEISDNPVPLLIIDSDMQSTNLGLADPIDNDLSLLAPSGGFEIVKNIILKLTKII